MLSLFALFVGVCCSSSNSIVPTSRRAQTPPISRPLVRMPNRSVSMPNLGGMVPGPLTILVETPYTEWNDPASLATMQDGSMVNSWLSAVSEEGRLLRQSSDEDLWSRATPYRGPVAPVRGGWEAVRAQLATVPAATICLTQAAGWPLWANEASMEDSLEWAHGEELKLMASCICLIDGLVVAAQPAWLDFSRSLRRRVADAAIASGTYLGLAADPRIHSEYLLTRTDVVSVQGMSDNSLVRGGMKRSTQFSFISSDADILLQLARQWNTYHSGWYVPAGGMFLAQLDSVSAEIHSYEAANAATSLHHQYLAAYKIDQLRSAPEVMLLGELPSLHFAPPTRSYVESLPWTPELEGFAISIARILKSELPDKGEQLTNESCLVFQAWALANGGIEGAPSSLREQFHMCIGRSAILDLTVLPIFFYRMMSNIDGINIDYYILEGFFDLCSAFDIEKVDAAARLRAAAAVNIVPGWFRKLRETPVRIADIFPMFTLEVAGEYADIVALCQIPFKAEIHVPGYSELVAKYSTQETMPIQAYLMMETLAWFVNSVKRGNWLEDPAPWLYIARHFATFHNQFRLGSIETRSSLGDDIQAVYRVCAATELMESKSGVAVWTGVFTDDLLPGQATPAPNTACEALKRMAFTLQN